MKDVVLPGSQPACSYPVLDRLDCVVAMIELSINSGGFTARINLKPLQDVMHMVFNRGRFNVQTARDFLVGNSRFQ
jgi:hypothetical protein